MMRDPLIRRCFGGVKASDTLPVFVKERPQVFISNTEPSSEDGQHWILLFMTDINEYFDPLGKEPLKAFEDFLIVNGAKYNFSTKKVQSNDSKNCGLFCLFFAYYRVRKHKMKDILDMFTEDLLYNEQIVLNFYYQYLLNICNIM